MKIFGKLIFFLRSLFLNIAKWLYDKITDPETGKVYFIEDKRNLKKIMIAIMVVGFVSIGMYRILSSDIKIVDGAKDFEEELSDKTGIKATELDEFDGRFEDPLAGILADNKDLNEFNNNQNEDDDLPNYSVCIKLLNKLKNGQKLNLDEKDKLKYCLENNITNLDSDQLDLYKMLAKDSLLDDGEKALLRELFGEEKKCQDTIDEQMTKADGNEFLTKIIEDPEINNKMIDLLKDQDLLKRLLISGNSLKNLMNFTDSEVRYMQELLENCSPDLLIRLLSDPKFRDLMKKLLQEAIDNPNFLNNLLNEENLSDAERKIIQDLLSEKLDPDSTDMKIAEALLKGDPIEKQLAKDLLKARELGDADLVNVLSKKLKDEELNAEEQNLLDNYDSDKLDQAYIAKLQGNDKLSDAFLKQAKNVPLTADEEKLLNNLDDLGVADLGDKELIQALTDDMARRQAEIDRLEQLLEEAKRKAKEAAAKIEQGGDLTPEEQEALLKLAELQKKLQELKDKQKQRQNQYAKKTTELYNFLNQSGRTVDVIFPSGLVVDDSGLGFKKCENLPPFKIVKVLKKKKKVKRKPRKKYLADGKLANPEDIRILKAFRKLKAKKLAEAKKKEKELFDPVSDSSFLGDATSMNQGVGTTQNNNAGMNGLFVAENNNLKPFELSPDMTIPARLMTEILVTDNGASQRVRVKILRDIFDTEGRLAIPKNSIAFGNSGSFSPDTGIMNLSLDRVTVGSETLEIGFSVGSGNLSPGLKGEVRDTRGKLLAGTFISSFTSGALAAISSTTIQPFQESDVLADTLTGAALTGGSEIAQRIAEMYASDLQNAPRVFFVPASVPVVLIPNN